jgi:hypothetical protein
MNLEERAVLDMWAANAAKRLIDILWYERLITFENSSKAVAIAEKFLLVEIEKLDDIE